MRADPLEQLAQKWHDCYEEKQALARELEGLEAELAEVQRRQKIALDNAYADGYEHGFQDGKKRSARA